MSKVKLGTKWECHACGFKFYDFGKSKVVCPKCGVDQKAADEPEAAKATEVEEEVVLREADLEAAAKTKPVKAVVDGDDEDDDDEEDDEDEDVLVVADDLSLDDDDLDDDDSDDSDDFDDDEYD